MRFLIGPALLTLLLGCASEDSTLRAPASKDELEACLQSVVAMFASRIRAPGRSGTGLCNVNGGMTLCQGASGTLGDDPASMRPLSAHERDSRILQQQCLAAKSGRVSASGN